MGTPRSNSPAIGTASLSKKAQNEAYFARMGAENLNRPEDLPPNQGGKYAGFGSDPFPKKQDDDMNLPNANDFQTDPVGALTKGFGWLGATVSRNAKVGYDGWVKPGMQKVWARGSLVFFLFVEGILTYSAACRDRYFCDRLIYSCYSWYYSSTRY